MSNAAAAVPSQPTTKKGRGVTSDYTFAERRFSQLRRGGVERWTALNRVSSYYKIPWQALKAYLKRSW